MFLVNLDTNSVWGWETCFGFQKIPAKLPAMGAAHAQSEICASGKKGGHLVADF